MKETIQLLIATRSGFETMFMQKIVTKAMQLMIAMRSSFPRKFMQEIATSSGG